MPTGIPTVEGGYAPPQLPNPAGVPALLYRPSSILTRRLASTSAASAAACAASKRCLRAEYSGPSSQWVASPFNAASSPTSAERSRAVSLVTSFGSWGPTYGGLILWLKAVE